MVVPSPTHSIRTEKIRSDGIPVIDLSLKRSYVSDLIVRACEEYGFFKVINHGVPMDIISNMEDEGLRFFAKPEPEKRLASPANPFGFGSKNIGFNGDMGEVEYLLLDTNNPLSSNISQTFKAISKNQAKFSCAVNDYIQAVRELACEILDLMAEGLWVPTKSVFSRLIRDVDNDSLLRINHYPHCKDSKDWNTSLSSLHEIGFGEHSDPQILSILRSNQVGGLQISLEDGVWVPIPPDPTSLCVNVGDVLQALTNGRFVSVRHRALANPFKSRMSMVYFGAPPLHAWVSPLQEMVTPLQPCLYRPFTWAEFKRAAYSLRLGDQRLDRFRTCTGDDDDDIA